MDNRKTSQGFAKFSIKTLVYVVMIVVAIVCATTAYSFGSQIFSNEGVDPKPGTDMTFTVDEGTSIESFGKTLEEFNVIKSSRVFTVQSYLYEVRKIKAGTYSFNTSQSNEEIFKIINAGPEEDKKEKETPSLDSLLQNINLGKKNKKKKGKDEDPFEFLGSVDDF